MPPTRFLEATIDEQVLRPTHLVVDLDQLAANLQAIRAHVSGGARILAVLKANAYGHGLVACARLYEHLGVAMLGVAYLEEGLRLRKAGITSPILVLGGIVGDQIPTFIRNDLTLTASSVDKLQAIDEAAAAEGIRAKVHLKIDTGMERIGVHWYSAEPLIEASLACEHVDVDGIYSHLANADDTDLTHARLQLARFEEVLDLYRQRGVEPPTRHLANSGAVLQLPEAHYDLVRPGLLLTGVYPDPRLPRIEGVQGALEWLSRVVYFKVVQAGNPVSYGSTWTPTEMTRVITVPVGYGDGYMRRMSGRAEVIVRGKRYPVVGRICMDQVMVDIGWDSAWNGDEVVLLGRRGDVGITVEELADWAETIPWEILTSVNTRVPRVFVGELAEELGLA